MLDYQLYGLKPWGYHLTNVLLHAATAIALFLVFREMTGRFWPSALVAALFAVHPLRVESVAWVAERKDVLSGLFFMLTLGAYVAYARRPFSVAWMQPMMPGSTPSTPPSAQLSTMPGGGGSGSRQGQRPVQPQMRREHAGLALETEWPSLPDTTHGARAIRWM